MFANASQKHADQMMSSSRSLAPGVSEEDVKFTLAQILGSDQFSRAHGMGRLLRYLIEQSLAGNRSKTTEFAIGLEVYERDAGTWYPALDPVVKTAIEHLRLLLNQFYSCHPSQALVHFSIPFGNYCPVFERIDQPFPA